MSYHQEYSQENKVGFHLLFGGQLFTNQPKFHQSYTGSGNYATQVETDCHYVNSASPGHTRYCGSHQIDENTQKPDAKSNTQGLADVS